jgi:tight adherence protein C
MIPDVATALGASIVVILVALQLRPKPIGRAAAVRARPRRLLWLTVAGVLTMLSPVLAAVAVICAAARHRWSGARRATAAARQVSMHFPDSLDLLVLSIRAGYLPAQAIGEIVPYLPEPLRHAFAAVSAAMRRGDRFADALTQLRVQLGPIAQPLVDSLSAADRYGLPLAPVLERLAFEARQQRRRDADATARELPVRLAMPLVLCTLPSFVLLSIVPLLLGALSSLHT